MQSAIRKRPEEIEAIIEHARTKAMPFIDLMRSMHYHSKIYAMVLDNGKVTIKYSCETDENFIQAKQIVENIYKEAEAEINQ